MRSLHNINLRIALWLQTILVTRHGSQIDPGLTAHNAIHNAIVSRCPLCYNNNNNVPSKRIAILNTPRFLTLLSTSAIMQTVTHKDSLLLLKLQNQTNNNYIML